MKCKDCNKEGCPYRAYTDNAECLYTPCREIKEANNFDWQSFRNQAAKDIMCAMIIADEGYIGAAGLNTHLAIDIADDLISKLKEKEKE